MWLLLVVVLVSYSGYFSKLGALGLVGPDEPRYVSIARAMERTGDWVTPRLNGLPWFEKPVLYYWTAGLSMRFFGESEFAARFPSALAALLGALAIAWAARRHYGPATSVLVLLMFPTSVATIVFARGATPDMLFTGTLAATMVLGAELVMAEKPNILHRVGFGFFLGAATLAKGPAAVILAGGSVALWALFSRKWGRAFRLAHPISILVFLATAVPWYALCAMRNHGFLTTFLLLHNVERFLTPVFQHVQPFWFFLPFLVIWTLPWSALLFAAGRDAVVARRARDWASRPGFYFGCWTIFTLIFFSASKSKLPGYILPAIPPLLLVLAEAASHIRCHRDDSARGIAMGVGATWLALIAAATLWLNRQPVSSPITQITGLHYWLIAAAILGGIIVLLGSKRRIAAALAVNALIIAGLLQTANWVVLPRLDSSFTSRATARAFLAGVIPANAAPDKIPAGGLATYRLDRAWKFGLEYYLGYPLTEWTPEAGSSFLLFTTEAGCNDIRTRGLLCEPLQKTATKAWLVRVDAPSATIPPH